MSVRELHVLELEPEPFAPMTTSWMSAFHFCW